MDGHCAEPTIPVDLTLASGALVRNDPRDGRLVLLADGDDGSGGAKYLLRSAVDVGFAESHRVPDNHFVADIAIGPNGEVAAVGTNFAATPPGPDDPFNAQAFIIFEPFGATNPEPPPPVEYPPSPFIDLDRPWYDEPVRWAWAEEITTGVDATHFAPSRAVTRAEVVVMMIHRAAGSPPPDAGMPFLDVTQDWQRDAVAWAFQQGITIGIDPTHFAPERAVTRGEAIALLHRASGGPPATVRHPFVDIAAAWQEIPVRWGFQHMITIGIESDKFGPDRELTRAELVTLLFRRDQKGF